MMSSPQFSRPGAFTTNASEVNYQPSPDNLTAKVQLDQALIDADGAQYANLKDRLDKKDADAKTRLDGHDSTLSSQALTLANKADQSAVTALSNTVTANAQSITNKRDKTTPITGADIDVSSDANKIGLNQLQDAARSAIAGTAAVNAVPAAQSINSSHLAPGAVGFDALDPKISAGFLENGFDSSGAGGYSNATMFNGWGAIIQTTLSDIAKVVIRKGATQSNLSADITVTLWESASSSSLSGATAVQQLTVPLANWNALPVGVDYELALPTPYTPVAGKYYAVTTFSTGKPAVQQSGTNSGTLIGTPSPSLKAWVFDSAGTGNGSDFQTASGYGLYFRLKSSGYYKKPTFTASQITDLSSAPTKLSKIEANGYIDIGRNTPGTERYINSASSAFKGWASIITPDPNLAITKVSIKKSTTVLPVTTNTTVRLIELSTAQIPDVPTPIQEWTILPADWNNFVTTGSEDYLLTLTTPYTAKSGKYYAVSVWNANGINVMQVGYNPGTEAVSLNSASSYFVKGQWTPNVTNDGYRDTSNGAYGLYFGLLTSNALSALKISGAQVPDHDAAIKALKPSKYSFAHEIHFENPLVKKAPNFLDHWLRRDKDLYVVLSGDSIFTHQYSTQNALAGVAAVPPNCDKRAFSGIMWELMQFGSPVYRRFDFGKNALVGAWDATWASADAPFFTESGQFDTYYHSGATNTTDYGNTTPASDLRRTTKVTQSTCPITKFGQDDGNTNYPKRISNAAGAYVTFVIPPGYQKFDFIYETNQQADDSVAVTVIEGAGKVNVNPTQRNFATPVEANGYVFSMKELKDESMDGYDSAIRGKRLFFQKTNINDTVTIKIAKSSDISKYLFYWGVSYWGTATEPNACHLINSARGSSRMGNIYGNRNYRFTGVVPKPDLVIQEATLINNSSDSTDPTSFITDYGKVTGFLDSLGAAEYFIIGSNGHKDRLVEPYVRYWGTAKAEAIKRGHSYLDIQKLLYKSWQFLYPNQEKAWQDYFISLMWDSACHPNDAGTDFFRIMLEPIFDIL